MMFEARELGRQVGFIQQREKQASVLAGGLATGVMGATIGGLGNLGYQAYKHYEPGLKAYKEYEKYKHLPGAEYLARLAAENYPKFKPNWSETGGWSAGAGGLSALLGGVASMQEESTKKKKLQEEEERMRRAIEDALRANGLSGNQQFSGLVKAGAEKRSENMRLGQVPSGIGPQQMYHALSMFNQARSLADPSQTLEKHNLSQKDFEGILQQIQSDQGDKYDFKKYKREPSTEAAGVGALGALVGGLGGYASGSLSGGGVANNVLRGLAGAGIGGLGGGAYGAYSAGRHNNNLLSTARVLNNYGLNKPEYLRQAMPLITGY